MKQKLRVFLTLLLCAVASVGWGEEVEVTFLPTDFGEHSAVTFSTVKEGITIEVEGSTSTQDQIRIFKGKKITISSTTATITKIVFNCTANNTSQYGPGCFASQEGYSYEGKVGTWEGSASSVVFTASSNQVRATSIVVTYTTGSGSSLEDNDLALSTTSLVFDLYDDASAKTFSYTTSSTGAVTVSESEFVDTYVDAENKTITVTPKKKTSSAQTITVSQAADDTYAAGSATFTVTIDDSTPAQATDWKETTLAELTANDIFVIVGNNGDNYALANNNGTSAAPTAVAVTVAGEYITSDVADNIKWNVSGNATDGYTFYPNGSTTTWLYTTDTNNGVRVGTNGNKAFTIDQGYLKNRGTSRYVGIYNSQDWRCYTSSTSTNIADQTFKFYKYVGAAVPMISAADVELAYDATSGSIAYTLTNAVDGGEMTAESSENWLTVGTLADGNVALTFAANSEPTPRTATVTLTYTYNGSETVTKAVTVTQTAAPVSYTTIPDLFNAATSTATDVNVTFGNWIVSGVSTNGKNVYVTDGTNGFVIFNNDGGLGDIFAVGNVLSGSAIPCKLVLYNGFAEITNLNADNLTITDGGTVNVADIALANLSGVNTSAVVSYEGLTCSVTTSNGHTNYFLSDGTTDIQVYNSLYAFDALEAGKQYNITGVYQQFNSKKEILPRNADDIVEVSLPSIIAENVSIACDATTGEIPYTINNPVEGIVLTATSTAEWISNIVVESEKVTFTTTVNESTENRIATITLNYGELTKDITVTQAFPVVDYATLPYSYDGTGAMIKDEIGLTESGVGSNNSKPGIKFDSTGDYVVLKMNEAPKTLYFDIKGNPGSGTSTVGTFKVQTSADGITYTDLETYTNKDNTLQKEMFVNFASEVRFIKWIYVEKKSGNIALGNIIASNVAPETIDVSIGEKSTGADGAYYSSVYYSNKSLKVPEGVECLTYKVVDGALTVSKTYNAGDVIPAGEAVVIKVSVYDGTVTFMVAPTTNVKDTESMLLGVDDATSISEPGYKYYKLTLNAAKEEGTAGFYFDKGVTDGSTINAAGHKCYLRVPVDQTNGAKGFVFGEETDGIGHIEMGQTSNAEIYNLSGQRVNKAQKGIYIVNGKKVVVK